MTPTESPRAPAAPLPRRRALLSLLPLLLLPLAACAGQKELAREAGMRSTAIGVADLGPDYKQFKETEHDIFSAKPAVTRLTQRKPVSVKYHTFKVKAFDEVTQEVNVLYGQYRFLDALSARLADEIEELKGKGLFDVPTPELRAAVQRKDKERISQIQRLRRLHDGSRLIASTASAMADSAVALQEKARGVDGAVASLKSDPKRSVMAPQMTQEVKANASKLKEVVKGAPAVAERARTARNLSTLAPQHDRMGGLVD
jgi:hypothetical protein